MRSTSEDHEQREESDDPQQGAGCNPQGRLKGVQVVYEAEDGTVYCAWLDLKKANGITWCAEAPPPKRPNPNRPPPFLPNAPTLPDCEPFQPMSDDDPDDTPLCWWTGRGWECGTLV